ncbi:MAG: patatin family protein [Lachnospiraceae bacterium]|nr:patatin family protein [Lachnospiraceae bacterium]
MKETGIMIEGGAMRSVFAAGVLDFFMEKGIEIPNVLAVSAGAYAGMNYVSGQKGRAVDAVIKPLRQEKYMGPKTFLKKGTFFDMDYLFDVVPKKLSPFDFETLKNSAKRFIINTTNCLTGESEYYEDFDTEEQFWKICRAANSLPFISRVSYIDDVPMLDGGLADALPIDQIEKEGWEKVLVILTRKEDYRKKYRHLYMFFLRLVYHKYPKLIKTVAKRADKYNACLEQIEKMEADGKALVFRPSRLAVGNNESNVDVLMDYYQHGYEEAMGREEEICSFLAT